MPVASPIRTSYPVTFPENVGPSQRLLEVSDERWGNFRKVVAVISEEPIDNDVLDRSAQITAPQLDDLAQRLWRPVLQANGAVPSARSAFPTGDYGCFEVWQFAYRVIPGGAGHLA